MFRYVVAIAALTEAALAADAKTVEIAPGVFMPYANMGGSDGRYSNYSLWMELGGRGLDTALSYTQGDVQPKLGKAVRISGIPRSELFITTKIPCCPSAWSAMQGYYCNAHQHTGPHADADINETLSKIGIEYADLILLHFPCEKIEDTIATYKVMERALTDGRTRAIGLSNFNASAIDALLKGVSVTPAFLQCGLSVGSHKPKETLLGKDDVTRARCRDLNITYGAYSPLNHGKVMQDKEVQAAANAHNVSPATVALRWLVQSGHTFTTASMKEDHDQADLAVFDFKLTDEEMIRLTAVGQSLAVLV